MTKKAVYFSTVGIAFLLGGFSVLTAVWFFDRGKSIEDNKVSINSVLPKQTGHPSNLDSDSDQTGAVPFSSLILEADNSDRSKMLVDMALTDDSDVSLDLIEQLFEHADSDIASIEALIPLITFKVVSAVGYDVALDHAMQLDPKYRTRPIALIVQAWGADSPLEALEALESTGTFDVDLKSIVINSWAFHDALNLLESIPKLPIMLRADAEAAAVYSMVRTAPEKAVEQVYRFSGSPFERLLTDHLVNAWAKSDPETALAWVLGAETHPVIKDSAITNIMRTIASYDPQDAFKRAQELDKNPLFAGVALGVIDVVARTDPNLAKDMANTVNSLSGWISVGRGYVEQRNWDQVMKLANSVAAVDMQDYWEHVLEYWALKNPKSLLDRLDTLPTNAASSAALQIAIHDRWYRFLDGQNHSHVLSFMSENDKDLWDRIFYEPNNRRMTVSHGHGFSKTYTMDEVLAIIHRDARKEADVLPIFSE